jgi:transcriptional regulator with XRE-family HTH domain
MISRIEPKGKGGRSSSPAVNPLASYLVEARKAIGLTQGEICQRVRGFSISYLSSVERGEKPISFQGLLRWCVGIRKKLDLEMIGLWVKSYPAVALSPGRESWRHDLLARLVMVWPRLKEQLAEELSNVIDVYLSDVKNR